MSANPRKPVYALVRPAAESAASGEESPWGRSGRRIPTASLRLRTGIDPTEIWPKSPDDFVQRGLGALERLAEAGDAVSATAAGFVAEALAGEERAAVAESLRVEMNGRAGAPNRLVGAHELAAAKLAENRHGEAALLLSMMLGWKAGLFDGLAGLASVAASLGRVEEARYFAGEAIKTGVRHPSAFCIAGLMDLEAGDRRSAQGRLAIAARLARSDPRFRDDLHAAQRALLLMHLS